MRCCESCHISYTGNLRRCPLCGAVLLGEPTPSPFPQTSHIRYRRTLRLASITLVIAALAISAIAWIAFGTPALLVACATGIVFLAAARLLLTRGPLSEKMRKYFSLS